MNPPYKLRQVTARSIFSSELVTKSEWEAHVRNRFFEVLAGVMPEAFDILRDKAFSLFKQAKMSRAISPIYKSNFSWGKFEKGSKGLSPKWKELRDTLIAWQVTHHLVEKED